MQPSPLSHSRTCLSVQREILSPWSNHFPFFCHLTPQQPLVCFLSLQTGLFWMFHTNGHKQCVTFCGYLFSFSLMFSEFIHIVACVIPHHGWIMIHCTDRPHFAYPFIHGWTFELFPPLSVAYSAAVNIRVQVFKANSLKSLYGSLLLNYRINLGLAWQTVQPSLLFQPLFLCLCPSFTFHLLD